MTVNSIVGVETMKLIVTIEGEPDDLDGITDAAGLADLLHGIDDGQVGATVRIDPELPVDYDDFDSIDQASWSDIEGDAEYASWYDGMTDNELAS
jgi:hypothetical protein